MKDLHIAIMDVLKDGRERVATEIAEHARLARFEVTGPKVARNLRDLTAAGLVVCGTINTRDYTAKTYRAAPGARCRSCGREYGFLRPGSSFRCPCGGSRK